MTEDNSENGNDASEQNEIDEIIDQPISKEFEALGIKQELLEKIARNGYVKPTEIQAQCIPHLIAGKDLLGKAKTGSGKTAAFLVPLIQRMQAKEIKKALIISPTRELADQIDGEIKKLSVDGIKAVTLIGGNPMKKQIAQLQKPHQVYIGTTGRIMDHMKRGNLDLDSVECIILDEADRLLDMGFLDETREIFDALKNKKQAAFFSATFNHKVMNLVDQFLIDPVTVEIEEDTTIDLTTFEHYYIAVAVARKRALMYNLFKHEEPEKCLLFTRTKSQCKLLFDKLFTKDYSVGQIHGDLPQYKRDKILAQFRTNKLKFLVATDVAARGLHVDDITHVINFDMPDETEEYIHRVGRTARMGKKGKAFTFLTKADGETFSKLEKSLNMQIPEFTLENFITGLDENGNEIDRRSGRSDSDENDDEPISDADSEQIGNKEGDIQYAKTEFETPKGFGDGLL